MVIHRWQNTLTDLGLDEHEAQVYLAALASGPATVLQLARASELKRTTIYSVLERLKQRGLMNVEIHRLKQRYAAVDPEKLVALFDERRTQLQAALPELTALYNLKIGQSTIRYYQGLAAVKNVYEMLLNTLQRDDYHLVITDINQWLSLDPSYFQQYRERRAPIAEQLRIDTRLLLQDTGEAREEMQLYNRLQGQAKLLPYGTSLSTDVTITPRQVVIHQLTPPVMAIVIENQSVVQLHRELFEVIWKAVDGP